MPNQIWIESLDLPAAIREELEYLRWWYHQADFGPADADVRDILDEEYTRETGNLLPDGYREE